MKTYYKIFQNPEGDVVAVKQGWSWPACFLTIFWAAHKHLLQHAFIGLVVIFGSVYITKSVQMPAPIFLVIGLVPLLMPIIFGLLGNSWYGTHLKLFGYNPLVLVRSNSPEEAIGIWQKAQLDTPKSGSEEG